MLSLLISYYLLWVLSILFSFCSLAASINKNLFILHILCCLRYCFIKHVFDNVDSTFYDKQQNNYLSMHMRYLFVKKTIPPGQ